MNCNRLFNPSKSEIGKIAKQVLDNINRSVYRSLNVNLWRNTSAVIDWFKNTHNKQTSTFIIFDIVEFYPSITSDLLDKALDFAAKHHNITKEERDIIHHTKRSILICNDEQWNKKQSKDFDVAMGSFDGAETCELVGLFLLDCINNKIKGNFGLYRDDGLGAINASPRQTECIKKQLCSIFRKYDLKITVECNKKSVDYLDVSFDLDKNTFAPFMKPNNRLQYIHRESNHPPLISKNLPNAINKRLSCISSSRNEFQKAVPAYQSALDMNGYHHNLEYQPPVLQTQRRKRQRNIIWFNPPFSKNVATDIGRTFLRIIKDEFHAAHPLHKIFNKNNIKVSYSCMMNIKGIIDGHNARLLKKANINNDKKTCNCRNTSKCPLDGRCLTESLIYQATVTHRNGKNPETYIGLTEGPFKTRYNNHSSSFKYPTKRTSTELSNYIWSLKEEGTEYDIKWNIICQANAYNISQDRCNLCTAEKFYIIYHPCMSSLNNRREIITTCRHSRKHTLAYYKANG